MKARAVRWTHSLDLDGLYIWLKRGPSPPSGGNQQKVVVGRSLARGPDVLLLDDPTAGIDIGSRRDLLGHVRRFADDGGAVIIVSSELDDLSRIADRVVILVKGAVGRELERSRGDLLTEAAILSAIHTSESVAA